MVPKIDKYQVWMELLAPVVVQGDLLDYGKGQYLRYVQFSLIWKCLAYHKQSPFPSHILSNAFDQKLLKRERRG